MRRLSVFVLLVWSVAAPAAEVTRVASSAEEGHPFGMFLDFTFDRLQERGRIAREWYGDGLNAVDRTVDELSYFRAETSLGIEAHVGLFRDLELKVAVPIVFQQDRAWAFAAGRGPSNTSLYANCSAADGTLCTTPGAGEGRVFEVLTATDTGTPTSSYRGGLGDFTFGLAWAPFVQRKDPSQPTWALRFDYTAPTAAMLDPSSATSAKSRGAIGERLHKFTWTTAISRRLSFAEPYFAAHYTLPIRGPGFYSNCDHPSPESMAAPQNCGVGDWTRAATGLKPSHTGGVLFGSELTVFERPEYHQRVAFDLRGWITYVSEGRTYNELSDLLHKLLTTQDHAQLGAQVAFVGQAAEFITLKALASLAYTTEHVLTQERLATQSLQFIDNGAGSAPGYSEPEKVNPTYDYRVDRTGRRFVMKDQYVFRVQVTATFNF